MASEQKGAGSGRRRKVVIYMSQLSNKPHGIFDDFSFTAVAASALTAATSFLLTSKIGLAGSLIGAMAAAVISTVSTQVYKGMLTASAERIREVAEPTIAFGQHISSEAHLRHAPTHDLGRFARRLAVFAACVSLAAVLVSAAVIAFATRGAGLGPTTWEAVAVVEEAKEAASDAKDAASEVKEDAAVVADKVENKVDELVEEAAAQTETTTDDVSAETGASAEAAADADQPSVVPEITETAEEPPAEEPVAEQEQPLTDQGLSESGTTSSGDVAQ